MTGNCARCNHARDDHANGLGKCSHEGCECTLSKRSQIKIPMKPREDLPLEYRLVPSEDITWSCPSCGHYEVAEYGGIDLMNVTGLDFKMELHFLIHCNGCDHNFRVQHAMDFDFLRKGKYMLEQMRENKNLPASIRKILCNKLSDLKEEQVIIDGIASRAKG